MKSNRIDLLDGLKFVRGDVVECSGRNTTWKGIVACKTLDSVNRYCVIPFRPDGSFDPKDNGLYIDGVSLRRSKA